MLFDSQLETEQNHGRIARPPSTSSRKVLISVNPRAGSRWRKRHIAELTGSLQAGGFEVTVTSRLNELSEAAGTIQPGGASEIRAVISVGGDGTASCVRRHVPLSIPILPVPMGTENLLSRYLKQASSPNAVLGTLEEGVVVGLDLCRANGVPFLLMISAGFDADVVRRLHENRRGNITRATYLRPVLDSIRSYQYPEMRVYCGDDTVRSMGCRWLFGFNLPLYALGWRLSPQACGADGELDVCLFERGSFASACRYLVNVALRRHHKLPDVREIRCDHFRADAANGDEIAYQIDGDLGGKLPVQVSVEPGQLRLLVSRATASRLGFVIDVPRT